MAEGVRKRGKTWSYYFDTAKINGERKKIEKGGFRTQKEALDARAAAIAQYNNVGRTFSPKEISVSDYLDYWLETAIKKNIDHGYSYNTYCDYESKINPKTVMERLGHKDITTTLQTYTFNTSLMQQNAVDVFENAIHKKA